MCAGAIIEKENPMKYSFVQLFREVKFNRQLHVLLLFLAAFYMHFIFSFILLFLMNKSAVALKLKIRRKMISAINFHYL